MSILAGMMIALGCILYINIGGILGAMMFSIGLLSVVLYKFKLFTGQAGKLITKEISIWNLLLIWILNLLGVAIIGFVIIFLPQSDNIVATCRNIIQAREETGYIGSFVLAIPCGMLMYMAVSSPDVPMRLFYISMCVMAFILGGFYHCVADMFYTMFGATRWTHWLNLVFVTLGNIVGCNFIPLILGTQTKD